MRFAPNAKIVSGTGSLEQGYHVQIIQALKSLKYAYHMVYRSPLTFSLVSVQLSKTFEYWHWPSPGTSSDMHRFPGSSTRKAFDLETSNGLVCNLYSEASIILDFCIMDPRILMEFESIIELTYLNKKRSGALAA